MMDTCPTSATRREPTKSKQRLNRQDAKDAETGQERAKEGKSKERPISLICFQFPLASLRSPELLGDLALRYRGAGSRLRGFLHH